MGRAARRRKRRSTGRSIRKRSKTATMARAIHEMGPEADLWELPKARRVLEEGTGASERGEMLRIGESRST